MATFELRRNARGSVSHRAKIRIKGAPEETASFRRLTDARRWAQATEAAIREGRYFKTSEAKRHTLAAAIDRYTMEVMPQKTGAASQATHLAWWRDQIGAYSLAEVTPALIAEHRDKLLNTPLLGKKKRPSVDDLVRKRRPATVVRYLALLSHVFSTAAKEWGWMEDNPVRKVRKPREPRGRERYLSDSERVGLLAACEKSASPYLHTIVVLALSTGMRRGEIMSLRWHQIDFKRHRITLYRTKNGDCRSVPLAGQADVFIQKLAKVRRIDSDLLFPGSRPGVPIEFNRPWRAALAAAGITDFRFHDLRHSAASYLAMTGASMLDIAAVLGHKTLAMVKRYSHLSDAHTQKVVSAMNNSIFPACSDRDSANG